MLNLSAGGMLASIEGSVPVKANVRLSFKLPGGGESFDLQARVSRVSANREVGLPLFGSQPGTAKATGWIYRPCSTHRPELGTGCAVDSCLPAVQLQEKDLSRNLMKSCSHPAQSKPRSDFNGIFRLTDGKLQVLYKELTRPNGLAFSPDEKYFCVANSYGARNIRMRFEVQPDETIANGTVFHDAT